MGTIRSYRPSDLEALRSLLVDSDFHSQLERYVGMDATQDHFDNTGMYVEDKHGSTIKALAKRVLVEPAILNDELSFEPYGIVLPRGDAAFGLAVNSALSTIYRNGEIVEIFNRWFAGLGRPSPIIEAAYSLGIIPE